MSNKLQKVLSEIDKVKEKIAVQQTRLRELEQQKTELENMEIVGMVRGLDVAPVSYTHLDVYKRQGKNSRGLGTSHDPARHQADRRRQKACGKGNPAGKKRG